MSNTVPFKGTKEQHDRLVKFLKGLNVSEGAVMQALQEAQGIYGYLPKEVQLVIADTLGVPLEEIYGVATFYSQFSLEPVGKYKVSVCLGTACYVKGSGDVIEKIERVLGVERGRTTPDGKFTVCETRCIGCCGLAPVFTVGEEVYGQATPNQIEDILKKYN